MTPSKTLLFLSLSFIAGVFFAPISVLLGLFFILLSYLLLKDYLYVVFCVLFFLVGAFSFHYTLYGEPADLATPIEGMVVEEPSVRGNFQRVVLDYGEGKALLYVDRYADYRYGDVLKVDGEFLSPELEDYANYLRKEGVYYTVFHPLIEKTGKEGSLFYESILSLKKKAQENIRKSVPVPQVLLLEAMLLGDRDAFSDDFSEKLSVSGTRHITAISGMHIVIISAVFFYLFLLFGVQKRLAAVLSFFCIIFFIIFVGAPTSAIRAGFMGGVLLLSYVAYRKTSPFRLLVLAAAVMLSFNPLLLHYDLGFQLSFLAVFGILSLHSPIKNKLQQNTPLYTPGVYTPRVYAGKVGTFFRRNERVADLLAVTTSAQVLVFPLILYNFGHVSLVSIPANVLIVPLLPLIMILGALTAVTGFVGFAFLVYLLLSFVLFVVDFFYFLPFSALFIQNVPLFFVVLFYIWLFYKAHTLQKMP